MQKQNLPLKVSQRVINFADKEAKRLGISRSEVIRRILDDYVDKQIEHIDVSKHIKEAMDQGYISKNEMIQIQLAFKNDSTKAEKYFLFETYPSLPSKLTEYLISKQT